jgi:hypothetical protein
MKVIRWQHTDGGFMSYCPRSHFITGITNIPCACCQIALCPLGPRFVESHDSQEKNDRRLGELVQNTDSPCPANIQQFIRAKNDNDGQ